MPDEEEGKEHVCQCSWMDKAKAICLVIGALTTAGASIIGAVVGLMNRESTHEIRTTQTEHVETAKANAGKLDKIEATTNKTELVAEKTERAAVTAATLAQDTVGPQLMSSWLYLKSLSDENPTAENNKRTAEAKAALDRHRALKP